MKKLVLLTAIVFSFMGIIQPAVSHAYNFGDFRSETLVTKAWQALANEDMDAVLAYTNKCVELYEEQAVKMQASLEAYPEGEKEKIFAYWALNDMATALFIQGEVYRKAEMNEEALKAYKKVISDFSFGQAWDTNGWFWKPAEAASEKVAMLESGSTLNFGDYSSSLLTAQAWKALNDNDVDAVLAYVNKTLELYSSKAKEMQGTLSEYPWESKEKIFEYWALNDVGTALFVKAEALKNNGNLEDSKAAYQELVDNYLYAQCWDPNGWFWKPAEAAQQALQAM